MTSAVASSVARGATGRRLAAYVALLASLALASSASTTTLRAQITSEVVHQYRLRITGPGGRPETVLVTLPRLPGHVLNPPGGRWPVVVALHGLTEALEGPTSGFLGWNVKYGLPGAYEALLRGRLTAADFGGLVRPERLARMNAELAQRRFEGIAVVTPYVPDLLSPEHRAELPRYEDWLAGPLLEQVRAAYPGIARRRESTGIDGVSLGGRIALSAGLRHPEAFGAVGGIQPAVRGDAESLSSLVRPDAPQHLRLLTSDGDPYLGPTRELSEALRRRSVPHDLLVVPGNHDYAFNRGPGRIELLRFHASALERETNSE